MANKTIYDLTENQSLDADDLFEQDVLQNNERKSLKVTLRAIADKIITSLTFSSLDTTDKTIAGAINEAAQGGGGGGGGHTIKDDSGTSLTQRANLQFKGVYSEDDSVNNASVVEIAREMTWAEYQLLSADERKGLIIISDRTGDSNPLLPNYSTTEHKTGRKWIDGRDVWEVTVDLGSDMNVSSQSWNYTTITASDYGINFIISGKGTNTGGTVWLFTGMNVDNNKVGLYQTRNAPISVRYITIEYLKSS